MAFQDRAEGWGARLHLTPVRRPLVIGVTALLALVLGAGLVALVYPAPPAFEVESAQVPAGEATADPGTGVATQGDAAAAEGSREDGDAPTPAPVALPPSQTETSLLCVHVDGCVKAPGVYYLEPGSRLIDAVDAAGGLAGDAATEAVNLAQELQDGQQVVIPDRSAAGPGADTGAASGGRDAPSTASALVNINTATAEELTALNGIGEATAAKIVADREANGPFAALEDLKRVSGIGDKKFEALRDAICL